MSLKNTIGNEDWLKQNELNVKNLFPVKWTAIDELDGIMIGEGLRELDVQWRTQKEFEMLMVFFVKLGFILREGKNIKQNPITCL